MRLHQHYGNENTVRNNVFAFGGEGVLALNLFWDVSARQSRWATARARGRAACARPTSWRALGLDRHSLAADPRFVDLARRDLRLDPDSPAFALGFRPIDLSDVGPRPRGKRD